jgi:hypothetical protein
MQQPSVSNGLANKYVSTATREHGKNRRDIFYAVSAERLSCIQCLGYLVTRRNRYGNLALQIGGVSNLRQYDLVMS